MSYGFCVTTTADYEGAKPCSTAQHTVCMHIGSDVLRCLIRVFRRLMHHQNAFKYSWLARQFMNGVSPNTSSFALDAAVFLKMSGNMTEAGRQSSVQLSRVDGRVSQASGFWMIDAGMTRLQPFESSGERPQSHKHARKALIYRHTLFFRR